MKNSVIVHGVLAAVGLAAAWMVYDGGDRKGAAATSVELFDCDGRKLSKVQWQSEKKTVEVSWAGEDRAAWVEVSEIKPLPKGATPTKATPKTKRFAASARVKRLVEKVAPLRVERSVGAVDKAKRESLGLIDTKDALSVTCGGQTRTYRLGAKTYGGRTRYLESADGGDVHLLASGVISDLEMAEFRFMQRDLLAFKLDAVDAVTVEVGGRTRKLLHRNRRDRAKAMWVAADAPDQRNELFANWLGKLMRLRALEYLPEGKLPGQEKGGPAGGKSVITEAVVKLAFEGDEAGAAEVVRIAAPKKAPGKAGDYTYYARSTATRGWVTVPASLGKQLDDDAAQVVGAEKAEAVDAPAAATGS